MAPRYDFAQRREYLEMTDRIGEKWLEIFEGDTDFYSAVYWDLLTSVWRHDGPVRKTDALQLMKSVKSPHTAGKYIETAIRKGVLRERQNPEDARSKLLTLSPRMRTRLDSFFDLAVNEVRKSGRRVETMSPAAKTR